MHLQEHQLIQIHEIRLPQKIINWFVKINFHEKLFSNFIRSLFTLQHESRGKYIIISRKLIHVKKNLAHYQKLLIPFKYAKFRKAYNILQDKIFEFLSEGTDSFSATMQVQSGHGRFIRQRKFLLRIFIVS